MKSCVWLKTLDGYSQQVEKEVAMICPKIHSEVVLNGKGSSENRAVLLPPAVTSTSLGLILDYCRLYKKKVWDVTNFHIIIFIVLACRDSYIFPFFQVSKQEKVEL